MILIIDDDKAVRLSLSVMLRREGYETESVASPDEALAVVRSRSDLQLMIMDMNFSRYTSGEEGLELLRKVKILRREVPVILITAWGSIPLAVEGMKHGAFDFITKPWDNRVFVRQVRTALDLAGRNVTTESARSGKNSFRSPEIIGDSRQMRELLATAARVAATDASVLILGENGTGKEMVAQAIHRNSNRRKGNLVTVNLGGIPRELFESEMFGHVRGSFTGAVADRMGRFEMADGGTIFLDEVGEMDLSCQVKLLRVLQEHTFERLGESAQRRSDFRVIAATNADLAAMVREHTFREDLYYRLNLITLRIPPLRERRSDIPLLARHFARLYGESAGIGVPELSGDSLEYLSSLPFPGNIRELKNLVERTMLVSGSDRPLTADDFRRNVISEPSLAPQPEAITLDDVERQTITAAMEKFHGNVSHVAEALGVTRQTLYRKLEKYGLR